jgi:hypothetical protein
MGWRFFLDQAWIVDTKSAMDVARDRSIPQGV